MCVCVCVCVCEKRRIIKGERGRKEWRQEGEKEREIQREGELGGGGEKERGKGRGGERLLNHPPSLALIRRCCPHLVLSLVHIDSSSLHIALNDINQLTL